ncbi:MAG: helix-turn-helix domain-containing protein [Methanobrevibacter sp.]|jgi:DNA-binding transcriptional ArsR family regulator|nr:helix-turn-helix domain-containing protein [Methanobrevibacter sp.]
MDENFQKQYMDSSDVLINEIYSKIDECLNEIKIILEIYSNEDCLDGELDISDFEKKILSKNIDDDLENEEKDNNELDFYFRNILSPLASPIRLEIFKFLFYQPRTFSEISKTVEVKGGNLQFHLDKLIKGGLILKNKVSGKYGLSIRGFKLKKAYFYVKEMDL